MAKQSTTFGLMLPPREIGVPAYRWLYSAVRAEILNGNLRPGAQLPATRDLADQYGLSRGTIVSAFDELKSEGYVEGSIGSGTYVSKVLPEELLQVTREGGSNKASRPKVRRRVSDYGRRVRLFPNLQVRPTRAFRPNLPALDLFPATLWAQTTARRLRRASTNLLLTCDPLGYGPVREAVANYLNVSRGVKCVPQQVAIVAGAQEALDLASRLFLNPGDKVCMENPGYPGAAMAFEAVGAKISAIGLDEEGMALQERSLRGARLIYITPGHQVPMGITMSLPRRLALLEWARKSGALIFEDDYDSEYRYTGRPVPAMQGLIGMVSYYLPGVSAKFYFHRSGWDTW
jgi:GntR family transcriptional regulator/MocR family aminotransferase